MPSNAYIARGCRDSISLMKVGKANDIRRRAQELKYQKAIAVTIEFTITCFDKREAHEVESQLRDFVIAQGGVRHGTAIDWFEFDLHIYELLIEFAISLKAQPRFSPEEQEIRLFLDSYRQIVAKEQEHARKAEVEQQERIKKAEREPLSAQIYELRGEFLALEAQMDKGRKINYEESKLIREARLRDYTSSDLFKSNRVLKREIEGIQAWIDYYKKVIARQKDAQTNK